MPGWDDTAGVNHGYLDRISFTGAWDNTRPIVWVGDDKFSILTSGRGRLLESIQFPQTIVGRPLLVDFNADGTTDILITSVAGWNMGILCDYIYKHIHVLEDYEWFLGTLPDALFPLGIF